MKSMRLGAVAVLVLLIACAFQDSAAQPLSYPSARKGEVVDEYFGTRVADPYRWMEELDSPELKEWLTAQTTLTSSYLERLALREHFRRRLTELWDYSRTFLPQQVERGQLFYRSNSGLERQAPVYVRAGLQGVRRLVLDPNALSPDGAVSLSEFAPSPDSRLLAYTLAEGGADWQTLKVRDIATGRDLGDELRWVRFSSLGWTKDSKGFFYSRYPEPPAGRALDAELSNQALYYHRVGTPQSQDVLVYERKDLPSYLIRGWTTDDGRYLLLRVARAAGSKHRLYYADLGDPRRPNVRARVRPVTENDDNEYWSLGNIGSTLYIRTDRGAPKRKIVSVDLNAPRIEWKTVIPERNDAIQLASLIGGRIVLSYMHDVQSRLKVFDVSGRELQEIALPGPGVVAGLRGRVDSPQVYYSFTSPLYPATVYAFDARTRGSATLGAPKRVVDANLYDTAQYFATSKDGTRVPYTITRLRDVPRNGATPTILHGYGGFGINLLPVYRPHAIAWMELGGAFVTANIRGGSEYGDAWFEAARAEKRQNGFDDFLAVAEHLVREKLTSPQHLGILGGSNGGLLVAAVSQQRPDLFRVVLPSVGVLDMLRFDRFTGGRLWIREYGSPRDPEQFAHLLRISPLHNVKTGTCYPATLVTTADHDDRVVPSHSFKYTAALQLAQGCERPVLMRIEPKASHGYRPTDRLIAEWADIWAFAAEHLGLEKITASDR